VRVLISLMRSLAAFAAPRTRRKADPIPCLPVYPRAGIDIEWIVHLETVRSDLARVSGPLPPCANSIAGRAA
jgi:hypothetical protein